MMSKGLASLPSWTLVVLTMVTFPILVWLERFVPIGEGLMDFIDEFGWLGVSQQPLRDAAIMSLLLPVGLLGLGVSLVFATSLSVLVDRMKTDDTGLG